MNKTGEVVESQYQQPMSLFEWMPESWTKRDVKESNVAKRNKRKEVVKSCDHPHPEGIWYIKEISRNCFSGRGTTQSIRIN